MVKWKFHGDVSSEMKQKASCPWNVGQVDDDPSCEAWGESEGVAVGLKREPWRRCAVSISGGLPELIMSVWFWIPEFRLFTTWGPCHLSLPLHGVGKKFHQLTPLFADLKNNSVISPPPTHHSLQSVLRAFFNDTLISPFILNIFMGKLQSPLFWWF